MAPYALRSLFIPGAELKEMRGAPTPNCIFRHICRERGLTESVRISDQEAVATFLFTEMETREKRSMFRPFCSTSGQLNAEAEAPTF